METSGSSTVEPSGEAPARSRWDAAMRAFARRGLMLSVLLFIAEVAVFAAVSSAPFFPGEEAYYTGAANQLGGLVHNSTTPQLAVQIFGNNYRIALEEMIPGFGAVLFAVSMYETARVTEAIAMNDSVPAVFLVILLFVLPHSWIELPAYAVATAEGLYLLVGIIRRLGGQRGRLSMEAWQLGINVIIVTIMLAIAAVFEAVEVALESVSILISLLTWIPFFGLVAVVILLNRRLSRIRKQEEGARTAATTTSTAPPAPPTAAPPTT